MKIGNISLPAGAALAPMAGITDVNMRILCAEMGCSWAVSEMLSAKGYVYNPSARVHQELITRSEQEGISALQLFGSEEDMLSEAIKMLNDSSFAFFDFNMGCPAHKIVCNGEGSALMKQPAKAASLIRAMVNASKKPVTVKIRAGWDSEHINAVEMAKIAQDNGAAAITIHPRTRDMFYSGHSDWSLIEKVKGSVDIPVIGNGDISSAQDAQKMLNETGCDGIMVARAAQGNVWIFKEILCALTGVPYTPPTPAQRIDMALRHLDMQLNTLGEKTGVIEMRKHIAWYLQGLPASVSIRASVNTFSDPNEVKAVLLSYKNRLLEKGDLYGEV